MTIKLIYILLIAFLIAPIAVLAQTTTLQPGLTGADVTGLQNILKTDPSIYPQGLATGFYGPATANAVKNLQKKYGFPQTGIVDSATASIIFPSNVQLKVLSPNGGENWDKSSSHQIMWQVTVGPIVYNGQQLAPSATASPATSARPSIMPFYHNVSIDLIQDSNPSFVYHIGNVDMYQTQYSWKIPSNISNASDYRIKITSGSQVPCAGNSAIACPMYFAQYNYSDVSDNNFTITGSNYSSDTITKINSQLDQIQQQINSLQSQLNSLRQLISSL